MKKICKHCGTAYRPGDEASSDFCCGGCEQVYGLIQAGGLDGYYALQDRTGEPLGELAVSASAFDWADRLQAECEADGLGAARVSLALSGMTCSGCVWLVQRLARRSAGLSSVVISLERQSVQLEWQQGEFSLRELLSVLQHFGYRAELVGVSQTRGMSPLAWRSLLSIIFALNGLLLAAPRYFQMNLSGYHMLLQLLALLFCFLSFVVGVSFFVVPVWRASRLGKLHYDLLPALGLSLALFGVLFDWLYWGGANLPVWEFLLLVALSLLARWMQCGLLFWSGSWLVVGDIESWVFRWMRVYILTVLAAALIAGSVAGWQCGIGFLLVPSLYPLERCLSYGCGRGMVLLSAGFMALGWILILLGGVQLLGAVLWMTFSGLLWSSVFVLVKKYNIQS